MPRSTTHTDLCATLGGAGINIADVDIHQTDDWQRVPTEDKPRKRNGAVLVFESHPLRLFFRNFATSVEGYAAEDGGFISRNDMAAMRRAQERERRERERRQRTAAKNARRIWDELDPADRGHPYLTKKCVQPHGIRQLERKLVIPMYDWRGAMWSYQTIAPDSRKLYMTGGRKDGNYYPIAATSVGDVLVLAEGFATGATVHECTGYPVAVCVDAQNLVSVAVSLRRKYPTAHFVFAADNDSGVKGNPGIAYATKAAARTRGQLVWPQFGEITERLTDWNDMAVRYSPETVTKLFTEKLNHGRTELPLEQIPAYDFIAWLKGENHLIACNASESGALKGCGGVSAWRRDPSNKMWKPLEVTPACHMMDIMRRGSMWCLDSAPSEDDALACLNDASAW